MTIHSNPVTLDDALAQPFRYPRIAAMFESKVGEAIAKAVLAKKRFSKNYSSSSEAVSQRKQRRLDAIVAMCEDGPVSSLILSEATGLCRSTMQAYISTLLDDGRLSKTGIAPRDIKYTAVPK